jgi:hypothetical protein
MQLPICLFCSWKATRDIWPLKNEARKLVSRKWNRNSKCYAVHSLTFKFESILKISIFWEVML